MTTRNKTYRLWMKDRRSNRRVTISHRTDYYRTKLKFRKVNVPKVVINLWKSCYYEGVYIEIRNTF